MKSNSQTIDRSDLRLHQAIDGRPIRVRDRKDEAEFKEAPKVHERVGAGCKGYCDVQRGNDVTPLLDIAQNAHHSAQAPTPQPRTGHFFGTVRDMPLAILVLVFSGAIGAIIDFFVGEKGDKSLKKRLGDFFDQVGYGDW